VGASRARNERETIPASAANQRAASRGRAMMALTPAFSRKRAPKMRMAKRGSARTRRRTSPASACRKMTRYANVHSTPIVVLLNGGEERRG